MSEINKTPGIISFIGYRLVNASYICDSNFEVDSLENGKYHFSFLKYGTALSDTQYQLNLSVRICYGTEVDHDNAPLRLVVELAGRYECQDGWDNRWEANALAILFPYLRAIVSTITAQTGREPILLPTVNIAQLFRNAAEKRSEN